MNEKDLKYMLKKSIEEPSKDFVEDTMSKIYELEEIRTNLKKKIFLFSILSALMVVISLFVTLPNFDLSILNNPIYQYLPVIISFSFLIFELNILFNLKEVVEG